MYSADWHSVYNADWQRFTAEWQSLWSRVAESIVRMAESNFMVQGLQYKTYSAELTVQSLQCRAYSSEPPVQSLQCGAYSAEPTVQSIQCRAYSAEPTMQSGRVYNADWHSR